MVHMTLRFARAIMFCLLLTAISSCSTIQDPPAQTFGDPIEGDWLLTDGSSVLKIAPCGRTKKEGLCGTLTEPPAEGAEWLKSNILALKQPSDPQKIVSQLRTTETSGEYIGRIYYPELDEIMHLRLVYANNRKLDALIYFGASVDEATDLAIGAIFSPVDMTDLVWLLARAGIGKTWLGTRQTWRRPR